MGRALTAELLPQVQKGELVGGHGKGRALHGCRDPTLCLSLTAQHGPGRRAQCESSGWHWTPSLDEEVNTL